VTTELRSYRPREDVEVWEPPERPLGHAGYWRRGIVLALGPSRPGAVPPVRLPALPDGHVRIFLLGGQRPGHTRGQTITHDTTDPDVADCVRRPVDNDGTPPCTT
jgi:hypothetical protein